ncbi:hypothetical protein ABBQ38_003646 [Trebouxia sp. C0009 RCD-2024]
MPPGAVAPAQKASVPAGPRQIAQRREVLRLATMEPFKEPARTMSHWDFVLKEMQWMAVDFTEEKDLAEMLEARINSGKTASTSAPAANGKLGVENDSIFADLDTNGDLAPSTPLNDEAFLFSYPANDKVSDFLSDYLRKIAEAEIISHELDIREYELDYEAAKKAAAAAAFEAEKEEERRIKLLEKNPLGELIVEEEEDLNFDKKPRRVKKPHHLDEFESGFDDEMELSGLPRRSAIDRKRRLPPALEPRESKQARREAADAGVSRRSTYKIDNNGKRVAKAARLSVPGTRFDGAQVRHPGGTPNAVPWSSMEEQLLCAVVHEFGPNFAFAADVLAGCSQLQGIFRRASQCKEKFKQLTAPTDAQVSSETALAQQITKGQAREIMQKYMPVPEASLHVHCSSLASIGSKHKQMHLQERAREQEKVQQNQPAHPSQAVVQTAVHSKTANRHLNAMEMIEWASTRHKREQIRQQQLEQQALAEQQRVQAQQAALAAGGMQQPPAAQLPAASASMAAQQGFPGQSMGPPSHASPMLSGPTSNGDSAMAQPSGGLGVRPPMGTMAPGSSSPTMNPAMQPFAGGAPPGTASQQSQQQQQLILTKMQQCMTNTQKLQQMLNTGKSSNNQPLTDELRQTYQNQYNAVLAHYKRLQVQYNMLRQGMSPQEVQQRQQQMQMQQQRQQQQQAPGMQPLPPQAQAQAQAMQLPGYAGYPNGMQGQQRPHMGMPQGTLAQGNMGMPQGPMSPVMSGVGNMQPPQMNGMGMGMPPNPMMSQQGMHPHMMGQQPQAPGIAGMMPPQSSSQAVPGAQQVRPPMSMQQPQQQQLQK